MTWILMTLLLLAQWQAPEVTTGGPPNHKWYLDSVGTLSVFEP